MDTRRRLRKHEPTRRLRRPLPRRPAHDKAAEALRKGCEKQLNRAEQLLYANQLASAQREWENNNAAGAWQYLRAARGDFRGWEHDYLYTLFTKNQTTLQGHTGGVTSVAFSPDGKRIVSGSEDKTVKVWDAATGQETLTLKGHTDAVSQRGLQPRRQAHRQRQSGQDGEGVGRGDGPGDPHPQGAHRRGVTAWPSAPTASASSAAVGTRR